LGAPGGAAGMSLLFSPLVLFLLGLLVARLAKNRRIWRRHGRFPRRALGVVLVLYTGLLLGLLLDHPWFDGVIARLPGATGAEWVINSGLLHLDASWPLVDPWVVALVILGFMSLPLWLYLGFTLGQWLFGTNPRQTGVQGLLR
jgi:hypothetical protein